MSDGCVISRSASSTTASRLAAAKESHAAASRARRPGNSAGLAPVSVPTAARIAAREGTNPCFLGEFAGCSCPLRSTLWFPVEPAKVTKARDFSRVFSFSGNVASGRFPSVSPVSGSAFGSGWEWRGNARPQPPDDATRLPGVRPDGRRHGSRSADVRVTERRPGRVAGRVPSAVRRDAEPGPRPV